MRLLTAGLSETPAHPQVERALVPALGGSIGSGTYYITKSELVINPLASEDAKADCREQEPYSARQALRFTAADNLHGSVLVRSPDRDSEDDPVTFTATTDTFTMFQVWTADNDMANCTYVYTFSEQAAELHDDLLAENLCRDV